MRFLLLVFAAACGGTRQVAVSGEVPDSPGPDLLPYVAVDADFMRNMIGHHRQAIEMASLVPDRSAGENMALLARRIDESQIFEIGLMQRWLAARNLDSSMSHGMSGMAGMATPEQMTQLVETEAEAFDKLFLELMIRHHEGALVMVKELSSQGGGLELDVFQLISHIDVDQRSEIARMQGMLNKLQ